jgi:hypothetical protein
MGSAHARPRPSQRRHGQRNVLALDEHVVGWRPIESDGSLEITNGIRAVAQVSKSHRGLGANLLSGMGQSQQDAAEQLAVAFLCRERGPDSRVSQTAMR